jgi:hypothetical protein
VHPHRLVLRAHGLGFFFFAVNLGFLGEVEHRPSLGGSTTSARCCCSPIARG